MATPRPVPDLPARPITLDEFLEHTPEKFELIGGYLFYGPYYGDERRDLLALLLTNVGLVEAVRLAPRERWLQALTKAYGQTG